MTRLFSNWISAHLRARARARARARVRVSGRARARASCLYLYYFIQGASTCAAFSLLAQAAAVAVHATDESAKLFFSRS